MWRFCKRCFEDCDLTDHIYNVHFILIEECKQISKGRLPIGSYLSADLEEGHGGPTPPPLILGKKKRIPEGRKAGRESRKKLPPPLSLRSGSANVTYDLLEVRRTDDVTVNKILPFYHMKQIHFMLPCISLAIDHQGRQNVIKNKNGTHSCASCATFVSYHITTSSVTGDRSYLRALFTSASFPKSSPSFSWHTTPLVRMKI